MVDEEKLKKMLPSFSLKKIDWDIKKWPHKLIHLMREYKRVILVTKKPDIDELSQISKVTFLGILLIGAIGFIMQMIFQILV